MTIGVDFRPTPKQQHVGALAGASVAEIVLEAASGAQILGVRITVNSSDDVSAANAFAARGGNQYLVGVDSVDAHDFGQALYDVYICGVQSGATNTTPTAGYKGCALFNESAQSNIIDPDIMQRLDFDSGLNLQTLRVTITQTWGSGRYALVRVEAY